RRQQDHLHGQGEDRRAGDAGGVLHLAANRPRPIVSGEDTAVTISTRSKFMTAAQVAATVADGATITLPGNASFMVVDHLLAALEARFKATGGPRDLTAFVACNAGLGPGTGVDRLAHEGLLRRYIASAFPVYK